MSTHERIADGTSVVPEPGFTVDRIVPGSKFHTINGLAFGPDGRLYLASVIGESIFAVDLTTAAVDGAVGSPAGHADDLLFTPGGDLIWNATLEGAVRIREAGGRVRDLATGLPGVNSIALTRDGRRLFVGQVFLGTGLWEIDLAGVAPPRRVTKKTGGGLNAFHFGPDGMIYAPTWEKGQVVRVDPETGRSTVLVDGLRKPGAVRFDARDRLYVLDDATGELFAVDRRGDRWDRRLVVRLAPSTDNMMPGPDGLIYVSNMADNTVHAVDPDTGAARVVVAGGLGFPRAIAFRTDARGDRLHVADGCAYRVVDTRTGAVRDVARAVAAPLKFPTAVSVNARHVLLTSEAFGLVQVFDHDGKLLREVKGFSRPGDAVEADDGTFVVSEPAAGRVVRKGRWRTSVLVGGLTFPAALADAGGGAVYVDESKAGRLLRVHLATGRPTRVAAGLGSVRSIAVAADGSVAVLAADGGRLFTVDPAGGGRTPVAAGLPIGYLSDPYPRSGGVAVGPAGDFYVAADVENAIYRIRPTTAPATPSGRAPSQP